ncbi:MULTISPECIES: hypothetical protein [unclassified Microcoleus]
MSHSGRGEGRSGFGRGWEPRLAIVNAASTRYELKKAVLPSK